MLFDISRDDIDQRVCVDYYYFIRDKKRLRQATCGGKSAKLAQKLKRNLIMEKNLIREKYPSRKAFKPGSCILFIATLK